jgi:predicted Zn-dependent protease
MRPFLRSLAVLAALAALLGACGTEVQNPVTGRVERTVMDERAEVAEGSKAHAEILKEYGAYDNPRLQAYVNELGQRLAQQSHRSALEWHFTVLDSPEVNAFALPGGYVYVTRGIMAYLDSEADLAGVIGHEIGHVTARHGAQRATRQQTAGLGVLAATILGAVLENRGVGGAGDVLGRVSQGVAAGYIASYSREQELQADQLGAEYLARSRYNPQNMVDVIGVLQAQERFAEDAARAEGRAAGPHTDWLSSHPSNEKRLQDITRTAGQYDGDYSDDGRARFLQAIDGMTFGDGREQGVVRARNFYHEPLGIAVTAPAGWQIRNSQEAITLVNGAGTAGLVIQPAPPQAGRSHDEIIRKAVQPVQGRTEPAALKAFPAIHFVGTRKNAQGQVAPVELTVATGPSDRSYLLVYGSRDAAALQEARAQLREAEATFRPLSDADRRAAREWRVKTVPYPRGGFKDLAQRSPLPNAEAQLRLINGVYGGGEPAAGQAVKVIE